MEETRDAIRNYIVASLIRNPKYKLGDNDKLISGGVIDSFSLVELSLFLEEKFDVRPDDTELNADNMDTVQMIANYVEAHRK
jgi:acyl carrier protein